MSDNQVIVRIAPSPTGNLHIGTARAALFNYLFAKKHKGIFIVRIEDTDKARSKKEYEKNIFDGFDWLGLQHDQMYRQSERESIYKKYVALMLENGSAYISKETPKEEGDRTEVIRFKNPNKRVMFSDIIRGEVSFDTTELGDFVIAKSLEEPLYHLAVVIDDHEMNITHVIRGEDHISNTPRQILIQEAIGAKRPQYAHIPLILAPDRSKLSKRHGATSLISYQEMGYLKDALINYLALVGWNPGTEKEIFTLDELIAEFSLDRVQKGGAVFNIEKLNWINKEHIKKLPQDEFLSILSTKLLEQKNNLEMIKKIIPIVLDRIEKLSDIDSMVEQGDIAYFFGEPTYEAAKLIWKEVPLAESKIHLEQAHTLLSTVDENQFTTDNVKNAVWNYAIEKGKGNVLWPLRVALSGKDKSPDPFTLASILGKNETLTRIDNAIKKIN